MGNCCWATPVDNHPTTTTLSPAPPADSNKKLQVTGNNSNNEVQSCCSRAGEIMVEEGAGPNMLLKTFTLQELKSATRDFRPDSVLGEGGFGRVFKGFVDPVTLSPSKVSVGIPVAVKRSNPDSEQGLNEWQAEVKFLGKFSHPNLVKLLGYCWDERQFFLVYEYMQKGSLESHLFRKGGGAQLTWEIRMKIAIGAARGLAFLHNTEKQVIYRDFKASNILLDGEFNAKLSDFGLAKLGPIDGKSHVTTKPVGTYGYAAPEYVATGHLYVKSDVYGFGVVLLEIMTGLCVIDTNRPGVQLNLISWAMPSLNDKKKLKKIIDPQLMGQYPSKAIYKIGELIVKCLDSDPKCRPSMDEVLETLEMINHVEPKPKEHKSKSESGSRQPIQQGHGSGRGNARAGGQRVQLNVSRNY